MKLRMLAWPGLTLLLLVANFQIAHLSSPGDSPINIGGGSIFGDAGFLNQWESTNDAIAYGATSPDKTYLVLHGLVDAHNNPAPSPLTNTGPWLVYITTAAPLWATPVYISFCSDPVMPTGFPLQPSTSYCKGSFRSDESVYAQTTGGVGRWERHFDFPQLWRVGTRIHFHNVHCDGTAGSNETSCDELAAVTVMVTNDSMHINGVTYTCSNEHDCYVQSGK